LQAYLRDNKVDVICIQESHLKETIRFFVRGFETFRRDRPTGHKGGVLTLIRHGIPAVLTGQTADGDLEHITTKLFLHGEELLITNCYSPPDSRLSLHFIQLSTENHLIIGDFNSHSPAWGYSASDSKGDEIQDWMIDNDLVLINNPEDKPSYYSRAWKKTSTPDIAMATEDIERRTTRSVGEQLGGSDHLPITLDITDMTAGTERCRKKASWNFKKANWQKYQLHAENLDKTAFTEDLNQNVKTVTATLLAAAKKAIPRGFRRDYKPYWSKTLATLHQKLSEARACMEENPSPENTARHNTLKEEFNTTKTKELQESWNDKTSTLSLDHDTGRLWRLIKTLNEDVAAFRASTVLEEDHEYHTGKRAANLLADVFETESTIKAPPTRRKEVEAQLQLQSQQQTNPPPSMTSVFTMAELNDAITRLKIKKAPGKDGVCNEMIKHLGPAARQKLLELFNQSWNKGVFPSAWKEAIIIPILKKDKDPKKKSSYRPISLLSALGKTLERMVNRRLLWHLETNNLITKEQTAFRKNRSTEDQLIYLSQSIENAFQEKKKVVAAFIDLSKAFDKVWKEGLLLKLLTAGVTGQMFNWVKSFLSHRTARVKLEGSLSHAVKIREGVPQGGVISPTLFVIFINDITLGLPRHISRALHADDYALWNSSDSTCTATVRTQEALNITSKWAKDWCVTINSLKTVSTCFSLSTSKENIKLTINKEEIPHEDTPTYLGVKLDKRLTWGAHIQEMERRATRRLSVMKKLAGTKWGANSKILRQVYTGHVRPVMEYGAAAWSTAAKSHTSRLAKVQNAGLRIITGGIKTTPIQALETTTGLPSLDLRREEKVLIHHEKLQRLPSHPAHELLKQPSKNRLKRSSFNHMARQLVRTNTDVLPEEREPLQNAEEWNTQLQNVLFSTEVPGVTKKGDQPAALLRCLTLDMLHQRYNASVWTHVYTDGSSDTAIRNGGSGILICCPDGHTTSRSLPAGSLSTNYRAELTALQEAARLVSADPHPSTHIVFLTDCKSAIQSLQSPREQLERNTQHLLCDLATHMTVAVQWIPAHCGLSGNEEADRLAKSGSRMEQTNHPVSYSEAKTLVKRQYKTLWTNQHNPPSEDQMQHLQRHQQTTLFRLRTGHCRLRAHMYRLGLSHTPDCSCETGPQTPEHVLQSCPFFQEARTQYWPHGATLAEQLWGNQDELLKTTSFILTTNLDV
jgi:ribonuclease HI